MTTTQFRLDRRATLRPRRARLAPTTDNQLLRAALDLASDAIFFLSAPDLRVRDANQAACRTLGYRRADLLALRLTDLIDGLDHPLHAATVQCVLNGDLSEAEITAEQRHRRGHTTPVELKLRRQKSSDGSRLIAVARDLTDRRRLEAHTAARHGRDPLTGLPNRLVFETRLQHALQAARRDGRPCAVIFIDLDGFKQVNDSLGHLAGDELLQIAARRLAGCIRPCDLASRFGGDEFVVLIEPADDQHEVRQIADRIVHTLEQPVALRDTTVTLGASLGLACAQSATTPTELLNAADQAMYRNKATRRFDASLSPGGPPGNSTAREGGVHVRSDTHASSIVRRVAGAL